MEQNTKDIALADLEETLKRLQALPEREEFIVLVNPGKEEIGAFFTSRGIASLGGPGPFPPAGMQVVVARWLEEGTYKLMPKPEPIAYSLELEWKPWRQRGVSVYHGVISLDLIKYVGS